MDREIVEIMGDFWGRSIQNEEAEEIGNEIIYSVQKNDSTTLDYTFDKSIIEAIKKKLHKEGEALQINPGRQAGKLWLSLIVMAYDQNKYGKDYKIKGSFSYQDISSLWDVEKGGKTYKDIRDLFMTLASAKFVSTKQEGDKKQATIYSLINTATVTDKEIEPGVFQTYFEFELNEHALGLTADWIRFGRISKSIQSEGYLSIPVSDLTEKESDTNYLNFRERLRLFKGGPISGKILLVDWIKLSGVKMTRRSYCCQVITDCLEKAKSNRELQDYAVILPLQKGWLDNWKITILK